MKSNRIVVIGEIREKGMHGKSTSKMIMMTTRMMMAVTLIFYISYIDSFFKIFSSNLIYSLCFVLIHFIFNVLYVLYSNLVYSFVLYVIFCSILSYFIIFYPVIFYHILFHPTLFYSIALVSY